MWWNWPTDPEHERRNFLKATSLLLSLFLSGFPVFLAAGLPEQAQAVHDQMDGEGIATALDHAFHFFQTVSWPVRIFLALFILLFVHLWRGGSISFRGRGLIGRRGQ